MAVFILECFSERRTSSLQLSDIIDACTVNRRDALKEAIAQLSEEHHLLVRHSDGKGEVLQLTDAGREYVGLAAADAGNHIPHSR